MRDITAAMVTIDRSPNDNYLVQTLGSLLQSDLLTSSRLESFTVFDSAADRWAEGIMLSDDQLCDKFGAMTPESKLTVNENVSRALQYSGRRSSDWVIFIEDDIAVCASFFDSVGAWLDDHATDEHRLYAFGAAYPQIDECLAKGLSLWQYPIGSFYGTQCFAIEATTAIDLSTYLTNHCYDRESDGTAYDLLMCDWAREYGEDYFIASCPSFVQHVGRSSIIRPRAETHTFPSWPGIDWSYKAQERLCHA